ncbi:hypothetical protein Ngar_c16650 [Candidatus Nitrososphaera gargensis Ga9.2]|uniref:Uncharacterized protein n=1 Tax=Nitrososphaera gargensis (strain Ga9.2) TaxID=1237085 RepID=K0II31_NITGG|nr:hypothetical protein [Candidatus Nitrososphaera gargensis]AFU58598.1 hypothetical protein Ngar_c16650 [Candidatus Nitrososphaera gargensis Ga9.2]
MNERQLKSLFCSALVSGHIKNNDLVPTALDIRIVQEAHSRSFDLLVAAITKEPAEDYAHYNNLLVRTQLLERFARSEKCRIDCVSFYPVEVKSDDDTLDDRLPNQIIDAILAFGLSIVVLDRNHSKKARSLAKFLPATIICYTGVDDHFEVVSKFDRLVSTGTFNLHRTSLARTLGRTDNSKAYSRLVALERILQKLTFNQIYFENLGLTEEELEFLQTLAGVRLPPDGRKRIPRLIKETANTKLTDYF